MALCIHDIELRDCAYCLPRPVTREAIRAASPVYYGPWSIAAYDGSCAGCGQEFSENDEIRSDGERGWLARCCGGDDDVVQGRRVFPGPGQGYDTTLLERFAAGRLDTGKGC